MMMISKKKFFILLLVCALCAMSSGNTDQPQSDNATAVQQEPKGTESAATDEPPAVEPSENQPSAVSETAASDPTKEDDADWQPKNGKLVELYDCFSRIFNPQFIADNGDVDYALLRRKRSYVYQAANLLEQMHPAVVMGMSRQERIAFWINTYNLCMLKAIIENYPIQPKWYMILYPPNSVLHISGLWDKIFFKVMGLEYNLKEIRNDLLLNRYKDPRICFALTDGARGGAILRNEPYLPSRLDEQLNSQVKRFLELPHGMRLDSQENTLYLSNVFVMNREVFLLSEYASILKFRARKPEERAWLNFLLAFLPKDQATYLENNDVTIKFITFDWNLNEK